MKQNEVTRKCIVSGEILTKDQLLRFVVGPNNEIIPDFKKKLPGKGIYVSNSKVNLQKAIEKNLFAKALKKNVKIVENLESMVESILHNSALQAVSLSRKGGAFITGMEKVLEALKKDKVEFLLEASDAGADGKEKILRAAKNIEVFSFFTSEELDKALDRINTVHCAFTKSEISKLVSHEFRKLADFLNS